MLFTSLTTNNSMQDFENVASSEFVYQAVKAEETERSSTTVTRTRPAEGGGNEGRHRVNVAVRVRALLDWR